MRIKVTCFMDVPEEHNQKALRNYLLGKLSEVINDDYHAGVSEARTVEKLSMTWEETQVQSKSVMKRLKVQQNEVF